MMKDNLIDEDKAREEEAAQETVDQKIERLEFNVDNMMTRFSRLLAEYSSFQLKVKQRMTKLESHSDQQPLIAN